MLFAKSSSKHEANETDDGYTINYKDVSIIEYIRFVSKITNTNFLFEEADLPFTVTVVSQDPITPENVMSTLVQILRMHGLSLLEQDDNLVIHKRDDVRQLAKVITQENAEEPFNAPLITRVFQIRNVKVESVASIIKPMISSEAILEVSKETGQLIMTDVRTNVDKVAQLIGSIDSPSSPMEIETYKVKNMESSYLISLTEQIMAPLSQGHPLIFVSHDLAQVIYIVSTPLLVEKSMAILSNLDSKPAVNKKLKRNLKSENVFIYKVRYRSGLDLEKALDEIADNLKSSGFKETDLIETIRSMRWIKETGSFLFTGSKPSLEKIKEILDSLDTPFQEGEEGALTARTFFMYKPKNISVEQAEQSIKEIADNLSQSKLPNEDLLNTLNSAKIVESTHSILLTGDPATFPKAKELLASIDQPVPQAEQKVETEEKSTFFLYKVQNADEEEITRALKEMNERLKESNSDPALSEAIDSMRYNPSSHTLFFSGPQKAITKLKELLPNFDTKTEPHQGFILYKIKHADRKNMQLYLNQVTQNLKSKGMTEGGLYESLRSAKWVPESNAFMFSGNKANLDRVKQLLDEFDVEKTTKSGYFLYKLKSAPGNIVEKDLQNFADKLSDSGIENPNLIETIRKTKWIQETNSILITGDENSVSRVKELIAKYDFPTKETSGYFLYKLENAPGNIVEDNLENFAKNLKKSGVKDSDLLDTIQSARWIKETNSILITGDKKSIEKVKELIQKYDLPASKEAGYFLYKLQNVPGNIIEEDLRNFAKNLKKSGVSNSSLLDTINGTRWVKETNSILITGDPATIEDVKHIIEKYDIERKTAQKEESSKSTFYVYKPVHLPPQLVKKSLLNIASNLKQSELADPDLLSTLEEAKVADTTNSVIFTGSPESIAKVKELLKTIDIASNVPVAIQNIGKTTYLLFKLQHASKGQITSSIRSIARDLKKSGTSDKAFLSALDSMRYVKDTNSLLFTGTQEALEKVKDLVEKFDHPGFVDTKAAEEIEEDDKKVQPHEKPSNFFVYKPKYVPGAELEQHLEDFASNLKETNLTDPALYQAIESSRWVEKTNSLIITGTPEAIEKVKALLHDFDVPGKDQLDMKSATTTVEPVDKTSFLVYKLQYHKGSEIQEALHQISSDMIKSQAKVSKELIDAINSIQWIKVTNSLLCTGNAEILQRLKELIKTLDIPLKQVFIEMLVIDTDTTYNLDFGLTWTGKAKHKDKWAASYSNISPALDTTQGFPANMETINGTTNTPVPSDIPYTQGFDLGIIGDVIRHKGNSFYTLGSLLTALQDDQETTIVTTPKVITQDGKTATIFIGQNIPYTGSFVSNSQSNNSTIQTFNLEYRDVGVQMKITPVLGNSDIVTLDLSFSRTEQESTNSTQINFATSTAQGITTTKTNMDTTVHVPNKTFLVLSGMVFNTKKQQKSGIPCLGGIPWLGAAFSRSDRLDTSRNVVIFMKPHIINSVEDMKTLTEDQEDYFLEYAGSPVSEEIFNEAIETFKSPNDE